MIQHTLVNKVQESSSKTRAMHVFMTLINWPLCIRIFCLSVLVSWGRKNTYNSVTVRSLLIQLSQKKLKGKSTSAIHVFLNQQQQKISDKAWGCGFTTWKKIFCGEQLELKLSLIWFYMGGHKNCCQKQSWKMSRQIIFFFARSHIMSISEKSVFMIWYVYILEFSEWPKIAKMAKNNFLPNEATRK